MPKRSSSFDFRKPVAYDAEAKRAFHRHAAAGSSSLPTHSAFRRAPTIFAPTSPA
jgi:hypothetical protein